MLYIVAERRLQSLFRAEAEKNNVLTIFTNVCRAEEEMTGLFLHGAFESPKLQKAAFLGNLHHHFRSHLLSSLFQQVFVPLINELELNE